MVTATNGGDRDVRGHPRSKVKFEKSSEIAQKVVPKSKLASKMTALTTSVSKTKRSS
jgi:hypothetical protein